MEDLSNAIIGPTLVLKLEPDEEYVSPAPGGQDISNNVLLTEISCDVLVKAENIEEQSVTDFIQEDLNSRLFKECKARTNRARSNRVNKRKQLRQMQADEESKSSEIDATELNDVVDDDDEPQLNEKKSQSLEFATLQTGKRARLLNVIAERERKLCQKVSKIITLAGSKLHTV